MGADFLQTIFSLSISGTMVGLIIFLIKYLTKKKFSKTWQYYIWLILIARLLLPIAPEQNITGFLFDEFPKIVASFDTDQLPVHESLNDTTKPNTVKEQFPSVKENAFFPERKETIEHSEVSSPDTLKPMVYIPTLVWLFGALLLLAVKLADYTNFLKYLKASNNEIVDEKTISILDDILMDYGIKRNIKIYQNKLVISPMLAGCFRPFLVLPEGMEQTDHLSFLLAHEIAHLKRKDIWFKWIFQLVHCLHWFNPLLYFVNKDLNRTCELSCDEYVLRKLDEKERALYGEMLLSVADLSIRYRNNVLSTTLIENKKYLKERLEYIMKYKKTSKKTIFISIVAIAFLSASATIAGAKNWNNTPSSSSKDITTEFSRILPDLLFNEGSSETSTVKSNSSIDSDDDLDELDYFTRTSTASKIYDDNTLICKKDMIGTASYFYYQRNNINPSSGKNTLTAKRMELKGSSTILIIIANQDTTIQMDASAHLDSGSFKIVSIDPSNKVSTLVEGTQSTSQTISLKKGRNRIKMIGKNAICSKLSIAFHSISKNTLSKWYRDESSEKVDEIISQLKTTGKIDTKDLAKYAPFFDSDDLDELFTNLIKNDVSLTEKQLSSIVPFVNSKLLGQYLINTTEKGSSISVDGLSVVAPFLNSTDLGTCLQNVMKKNSSVTLKQLNNIIPFLNSSTAGKVLIEAVKNDKNVNPKLFSSFYPFMKSADLGNFFRQYIANSNAISISELNNAAPFMKSSDIMYVLESSIEKGILCTSKEFSYLTPFMNSKDVGTILNKLMNANQKMYITDILDMAYALNSSHLGSLVLQFMDTKKDKITYEDISDIAYFMNSGDLAACYKKLIKKGVPLTKDDLYNMDVYLNSTDIADLIKMIQSTK